MDANNGRKAYESARIRNIDNVVSQQGIHVVVSQ